MKRFRVLLVLALLVGTSFAQIVNPTGSSSSGTVTSFSSGDLSPLFTTSVANATSTPALSFSLSNAGAGTILGNKTGSAAAPAFTAVPVLGLPGTTLGTLGLAGNTSGTITIQPQAAAGTFNFNLPTGAGTSGQPLLSGGGGATAMTFGTLGVAAGGSGLTTGTSGGVLGFTGATTLASSAALAAGAAVLGGGAGATPTTSSLTYSQPTLTVSSAGNGNGVLALSGNTSGTATLTAPAVAGTSTNAITSSNRFIFPNASAALPALAGTTDTTTGFYWGGNGDFLVSIGGTAILQMIGAQLRFDSGEIIGISSGGVGAGNDIAISRSAANVLAVGTGAAGNSAGTLKFKAQRSDTNCQSSGGTCGSAMAGMVSIAAGATTVTVSTTSVTANSEIFVQEDSTLGTALSVTCNTTIARSYQVTTRTAATSFVISASAAPVTNPACLSYFIIN